MSVESVTAEETRFGFIFGAAHVERMFSHKGAVAIWIGTGAFTNGAPGIEVSVSPHGRSIRVFRNGIELKEADK